MNSKMALEIALEVLVKMIGKKNTKEFCNRVEFYFGKTLPASAIPYIPVNGWAGFCCIMDNGKIRIIVNPEKNHSNYDAAYTLGHEMAHAFQAFLGENMNHKDNTFKLFKTCFAHELKMKKGLF